MDVIISQAVKDRQSRKKAFIIGFGIVTLAASVLLVRNLIEPTVKKADISTAMVEVGNVENTINASGEFLPEFEQVITSPINSSIKKVMINAGSSIKPNQPILTLDKTATLQEYEKQKFELESKRSNLNKIQLGLQKAFYDIQSNNQIKQLKINSLKATLEDTRRLFKAGGATKEDVDQAELNLKVAELEKKQLENEVQNKARSMKEELRESQLSAAIQENNLNELSSKLKNADILSNQTGVITWVNRNIGASIKEGETLAKIADLSSYKVSGTVSDSYLDQLRTGIDAIIRINNTSFDGVVSNVSPSIQNGLISFEVQLKDRNNKLFRPNMKVEVFLVTARKSNVLRVPNGPAFKGADLQDIFIVKDGRAVRETVHTGLSNFDYIEIKDKVKAGDMIITSDMSDYKNADVITIKD